MTRTLTRRSTAVAVTVAYVALSVGAAIAHAPTTGGTPPSRMLATIYQPQAIGASQAIDLPQGTGVNRGPSPELVMPHGVDE
jgi:hypothetical protein